MISLVYMPNVGDVVVVGMLNGKPLSFREGSRTPYVDGIAIASSDEFRRQLLDAVDRIASGILGGEWSSCLARVTGLNRRTVTPDRIAKYGMASWVLKFLGYCAFQDSPRSFGHLLQAARIMHPEDMDSAVPLILRDLVPPNPDPSEGIAARADRATYLIGWIDEQRHGHARGRTANLHAAVY